jgi:hypothetical protein
MKKPRVEDFDPNAIPELGSPLDNYPQIERPTATIRPVGPAEKRLFQTLYYPENVRNNIHRVLLLPTKIANQ